MLSRALRRALAPPELLCDMPRSSSPRTCPSSTPCSLPCLARRWGCSMRHTAGCAPRWSGWWSSAHVRTATGDPAESKAQMERANRDVRAPLRSSQLGLGAHFQLVDRDGPPTEQCSGTANGVRGSGHYWNDSLRALAVHHVFNALLCARAVYCHAPELIRTSQEDEFALDFAYPLSMLHALAIILTTWGW